MWKYFLFVVFIFCALINTSSTQQNKIVIKPGETVRIQNDGYPNALTGTVKAMWKLETDIGGAISLHCETVHIKAANYSCKNGNITLDSLNGGRRYFICDEAKEPIRLLSIKNNMQINMNLQKAEGKFSCTANGLQKRPEVVPVVQNINLKPLAGYNEITMSPVRPYEHYIWNLKTLKGYQIVISCITFIIPITSASEEAHCQKFEAKFTSFNKTERYCKAVGEGLRIFSVTEEMKISMKSSLGASGLVDCRAKSALPNSVKSYKHIKSEEVDSSEFGLITNTGKGKLTTCNCGLANKDSKRIIYGKDAGPHEYPWMVSVQEFRVHFCGGSIITEHHVITAAHCTIVKQAKWVKVVVGVNDYRDFKGGQEIQVKNIINHDFNKDNSARDIALLELQDKIVFNSKVSPICLPTHKGGPQPVDLVGRYVTAIGWGKLADDEANKKNKFLLKETRLRVIDLFTCSLDWGFKWDTEEATLICTWSNHTDICMGDSGGPLVWLDPETNRYVLVGMPSYCDGCKLIKPSAHTSVYYFYNWIQDNISKTSYPEAKTCSKIV